MDGSLSLVVIARGSAIPVPSGRYCVVTYGVAGLMASLPGQYQESGSGKDAMHTEQVMGLA